MNKNKIISNLFKRLLLNNFDKEDIKKLLFCYNDFFSFNNFIFYLFQLSKHNDDSLFYKMCSVVESYLNYLVEVFAIHSYDLKILEENKIYHPIEIKAMSKEINVLNLLHNEYDKYKDAIFLFKTFPLNQDIHIFIENEYYGIYQSNRYLNYFLKDLQITSTLFINTKNQSTYHWIEINNFIISKYWESLSLLKSNLISLINTCHVVDNTLYDSIYDANNHFTCFNAIINFLMWTKHDVLYNKFIETYADFLKNYSFNINLLFDNISVISPYELVLLTNGYDVLMGEHVGIDCMQNVYLIVNDLQYDEEQNLLLPLFDNLNQKYFDATMNQLILSTTNNDHYLYIFKAKSQDRFLFLGAFKVKGINLNEKDQVPIFKLTKTIPSFKNINQNTISNNYINSFYKKFNHMEWFSKFSNQKALLPVEQIDISTEIINSLQYKYNWVINRFLISNDFDYAIAYQNFDAKLINYIAHVLKKKYLYIFDNKIVANWALCSDIYQHKKIASLAHLIYYDCDVSIPEQNKIIKNFLFK